MHDGAPAPAQGRRLSSAIEWVSLRAVERQNKQTILHTNLVPILMF